VNECQAQDPGSARPWRGAVDEYRNLGIVSPIGMRPLESGRTRGASAADTALKLQVFGDFALSRGGCEVIVSGLKSRALLAFLACNAGKPQSRDKLIGLLWAERFEAQARQSLRHALSELRKVLGSTVLRTDRDNVELDRAFSSDVSQLDTLLSGEPDGWRDGIALFQKDLLVGFAVREPPFMDWLAAERARLRDIVLGVLDKLFVAPDWSLSPAERLELAQWAISLEPYREQAHRQLLRALVLLGRRNDAVMHFRQLESTLSAELGVQPESTTCELFEAIRLGHLNATLYRSPDADAGRIALHKGQHRTDFGKPSIAVLPFVNLSNDCQQDYLCDGISGDIITDLARLHDFLVIARNSSFAYKTRAVDVRQVGKELGVRYVLEGSLQTNGKKVRVTAELVDAATGAHVWAARYERPQGDLFAIQDEITEQVVNSIGGWSGRLACADRNAVKRRPPASFEAYDFYLLGIEQKHRFSREGSAEAVRLLSRAVELDPGFARAWTSLGLAYIVAAANGFMDDRLLSNRRWRECIEKALALDPSDPKTRTCMGDLRAQDGDLIAAAEEYQRALAISSGDADTLALIAGSLALVTGDPHEGTELVRRAIRLNPNTPTWYFSILGRTEYVRAAYRESIAALMQAPPQLPATLLFLAMAHAQLSEFEEAQTLVARLTDEFPSFTVEGFIHEYPVTNPPALVAIREGARKARLLPT